MQLELALWRTTHGFVTNHKAMSSVPTIANTITTSDGPKPNEHPSTKPTQPTEEAEQNGGEPKAPASNASAPVFRAPAPFNENQSTKKRTVPCCTLADQERQLASRPVNLIPEETVPLLHPTAVRGIPFSQCRDRILMQILFLNPHLAAGMFSINISPFAVQQARDTIAWTYGTYQPLTNFPMAFSLPPIRIPFLANELPWSPQMLCEPINQPPPVITITAPPAENDQPPNTTEVDKSKKKKKKQQRNAKKGNKKAKPPTKPKKEPIKQPEKEPVEEPVKEEDKPDYLTGFSRFCERDIDANVAVTVMEHLNADSKIVFDIAAALNEED